MVSGFSPFQVSETTPDLHQGTEIYWLNLQTVLNEVQSQELGSMTLVNSSQHNIFRCSTIWDFGPFEVHGRLPSCWVESRVVIHRCNRFVFNGESTKNIFSNWSDTGDKGHSNILFLLAFHLFKCVLNAASVFSPGWFMKFHRRASRLGISENPWVGNWGLMVSCM